jgi:glycolate oxidase iron-sulfur subunit
MLTGCVQQVLFPQVNAATARVLAAEGCDVIVPEGQGCCGALSLHGGRRAEAAAFARATIETFGRAAAQP